MPCSSECAPSGRSLCLEVRSKHLASFLGLVAPNCCAKRHFTRSRRDVRDAHRYHARLRATGITWSTKSQHGRTGEKLRENPTMLTARPASDCRENGAGIQLSGIARLEESLPSPSRSRCPRSPSLSLPSISLSAGGSFPHPRSLPPCSLPSTRPPLGSPPPPTSV